MSWTDERVETLKKMWGEGQSASQIAKELGGVTRNAVIGKVHRLGLSNRVVAGKEAVGAPPHASSLAPKAAAKVFELKPTNAPQASTPKATGDAPAPKSAVKAPDAPLSVAASIVDSMAPIPLRKSIVPAGQPLPPQPSANEISPETLASVREVEKRAMRLTLMELTERTCKWPIGDPATDEFWFCGLTSVAGKPYCEAHVSVAFQPMSARRDRRR